MLFDARLDLYDYDQDPVVFTPSYLLQLDPATREFTVWDDAADRHLNDAEVTALVDSLRDPKTAFPYLKDDQVASAEGFVATIDVLHSRATDRPAGIIASAQVDTGVDDEYPCETCGPSYDYVTLDVDIVSGRWDLVARYGCSGSTEYSSTDDNAAESVGVFLHRAYRGDPEVLELIPVIVLMPAVQKETV